MIIVHMFLRELKHKVYLMADSSANEGASPLWSTPEVLFEVDPETRNDEEWIERARKAIERSHPYLKYMSTMRPKKRKCCAQTFDLLFEYKPQVTLLHKLIGKKKKK